MRPPFVYMLKLTRKTTLLLNKNLKFLKNIIFLLLQYLQFNR